MLDAKPPLIEVARARSEWMQSFDTILLAMLDPEAPRENAERRIRECAMLADVALEEIERRWFGE